MKIRPALLFLSYAAIVLFGCHGQAPPVAEQQNLSDHPIYKSYAFGEGDNVIDLGTQPLLLPASIITEVMSRDLVLREALAEQGFEIRFHSFFKGADVNYFIGQGELEVGIGGDMPALTAITDHDVKVAALILYGFSSIVAKHQYLVNELRGKRIGYPFGSNSHAALLQVLSGAGLTEKDVVLVSMEVNEMPDALNENRIDAFCSWEPIPTIATNKFADQIVMSRAIIKNYIYFSSEFTVKHPEVVKLVVAAEIRAIHWVQLEHKNLLMACGWNKNTARELIGSELEIGVEQMADLAKMDIIGQLSVPMIPRKDLYKSGSLYREFRFLQDLGKIPPAVLWEDISDNFHPYIMKWVINNPNKYSIRTFRYITEGAEE